MLTNMQRILLGLSEVVEGDEVIDFSIPVVEKTKVYIHDNKIIKLIHMKDHLYKEIDYEIPLDDEKRIIGRKGTKSKEITFANILRCKTKKMRLTVDSRYYKYELKNGITHFKVMYFEKESPTLKDFQSKLIELYSSLEEWEYYKTATLKKTKSRYLPKEGDIFSYPISNNEYAFALIIGSFAKFRKNQMMPKDRKHYLHHMWGVPLVIRSFDFTSKQNQVNSIILRKHNLLNPEIIMDDNILRGTYPVIGHTMLQVEDIVLPMSFSFNGKHTTYAGYRACGQTDFETLNSFKKDITVRFDWGFGSTTMEAPEFLRQQFSEKAIFNPMSGCGMSPCSINRNKLGSPETIFSDKEIKEIFQLLNIKSKINFDEFNKKYNGITRQEYLNQ